LFSILYNKIKFSKDENDLVEDDKEHSTTKLKFSKDENDYVEDDKEHIVTFCF